MKDLHGGLLVAGLLIGLAGSIPGRPRPPTRALRVPATVAGVLAALAVLASYPPFAVVPLGALVIIVVASEHDFARDREREATEADRLLVPYGALVAMAVPAVAAVYLSVPDTEGAVVLGAALVPLAAMSWIDGWRGGPVEVLVAGTALVAGMITVAWVGADGDLTPAGWWIAKLGLLVVFVALVAVFARSLRTSAPARPSP